jgi:hypothetical protein
MAHKVFERRDILVDKDGVVSETKKISAMPSAAAGHVEDFAPSRYAVGEALDPR